MHKKITGVIFYITCISSMLSSSSGWKNSQELRFRLPLTLMFLITLLPIMLFYRHQEQVCLSPTGPVLHKEDVDSISDTLPYTNIMKPSLQSSTL